MLDVNGEPCVSLEKENYLGPFFCEQSLMEIQKLIKAYKK